MAHKINVLPESFLIMAALIVSLQWPIIRCIIRLFTEKPYHIGCIHIVHSPMYILICVFRSFASVAALSKIDIAFHQSVFSDISEILITVMPLIWAFPYVYILQWPELVKSVILSHRHSKAVITKCSCQWPYTILYIILELFVYLDSISLYRYYQGLYSVIKYFNTNHEVAYGLYFNSSGLAKQR